MPLSRWGAWLAGIHSGTSDEYIWDTDARPRSAVSI